MEGLIFELMLKSFFNCNNQVIKIFFVLLSFEMEQKCITWNLVFYFAFESRPSLEGPIIKEFGTKVKEEVTLDQDLTTPSSC